MKISQITEQRDMCTVCGQTPCNCTHIMESDNNPYGYKVGQQVELGDGQQGQVTDIFDDSIEVLLPGGQTVTVDFRDAQVLDEFVTPAQQAQDPGLERERDVDVIFYGEPGRDWKAEDGWAALEEVLPREYPAGDGDNGHSLKAQQKVAEVSQQGGAVVTNKPLSVAQRLVQTFNTYGIKSRINQSMEEGSEKSQPPEADYGADYQDMVARVKKLAGLGPLKTVYDPKKRVYKNMPTAQQPKK